MKILIVEDDFASRTLMNGFLKQFGECHIAVNGKEAIGIFLQALETDNRYDLICLDILMPLMDGQEVLKKIREIELRKGIRGSQSVKIIMTTALSDKKNILGAFNEQCEAYIVKPIKKEKIIEQLSILGLINKSDAVETAK
jgi:two-component system chemotaxis response regulator CheY